MVEQVAHHPNGAITLRLFLFGVLPMWFLSLSAPMAFVTWSIEKHEKRPHVGAADGVDITRVEKELAGIKAEQAAIREQQTQILLEIAALRR